MLASLESVFEIIAEPNRRAILSLLVTSQRSVGEIERQLRMSQPTVSKHLRVLRKRASSSPPWTRNAGSIASSPSLCARLKRGWRRPAVVVRHVDALELISTTWIPRHPEAEEKER